jgi:hypothetical protein
LVRQLVGAAPYPLAKKERRVAYLEIEVNVNRPTWGCYAAQLGDCSGPLNREHFVSKNLLKEFEEDGRLQIRGYPHGNDLGTLLMCAESMSAKILCEGHNSRLSDVDREGGRFILAFFDTHNGLLGEKFTIDKTYECDGPLVERWMLKYCCGLLASGQAGFGPDRIEKTTPPLEFLQVLFGLETLPKEWGLHTRPTNPIGVSEQKNLGLGLYLPLQPTGTRHVCGVRMEHYGFTSILALRTPQKPFVGTDLEGSIHHPEFFEFSYASTGRRAVITVKWPEPIRGVGFTLTLQKGKPPT